MNPSADTQPKLVGISGPLKDRGVSLASAEISIGRDPNNHLWITDPALSRQHCAIRWDDEHFTIRDLGSRNGTLVNGKRINEQALRHRDQVTVGDSVLVFLTEGEISQSQGSKVELTETVELVITPTLLYAADAIYLQPDRISAALPETDRVARDLNTLLKIANGIGSIRDRESLAWQVLGMVFDVVPAERGAILYFNDGIENLDSAIAWDRVEGPGNPVRVSRSVVQRVLREQAGLLVRDVDLDDSFSKAPTLKSLQIRCLLCVPLIASNNVIGIIYLDSRKPNHQFDPNHLQVMTGVANLTSLALENIRRWEELREENRSLRAEIEVEHGMVGSSTRIREILDIIQRVAPTTSTVLIQGESGTGKELVARAIHCNSPRAERPFVAINCAALTEYAAGKRVVRSRTGRFYGSSCPEEGKN